jgi:hypothetical protein
MALACFNHVPKYEPEFCLDAARKVNPSRSMLLEPEQPEHSSRVVRTRPIETDQLRLLKTLHGKATELKSDSSDPGQP